MKTKLEAAAPRLLAALRAIVEADNAMIKHWESDADGGDFQKHMAKGGRLGEEYREAAAAARALLAELDSKEGT